MDEAAASHPQVHTAGRTPYTQDQGGFRIHFNFPGLAVPEHEDHGYGPLATVVESFLDPGTHIGMHPHRDEEIISWVPAGVMRHEDQTGTELELDASTLMVMGAGRQFWHAERTLRSDPPLRMLQIFVRPPALGLEPQIDHATLPAVQPDRWRHLFGPTGGDAPVSVRNAVDCYDCRLTRGRRRRCRRATAGTPTCTSSRGRSPSGASPWATPRAHSSPVLMTSPWRRSRMRRSSPSTSTPTRR
jgi:Pirin-related protein